MRIKKIVKIFIYNYLFFCKDKNRIEQFEGISVYEEDIPECPICFKDTTNSMVTFLKCDHWACSECVHKIVKLSEDKRRCHMCRVKFKKYPQRGEV